MPTSRQAQADATKRRIFDCALRLLTERDYDSITVRDIVRAAEVSIGSFYHYYSTKLEVFLETYSIADDYFETVVTGELAGRSFEEKFSLYFRHYALYACEVTGLELTKLLYSSDNKRFERGDSAGMHRVLIEILQQGIDEGALVSARSAPELSHFFLIAVRGLVYNWCTSDGAYALPQATEDYVRALRRAFER